MIKLYNNICEPVRTILMECCRNKSLVIDQGRGFILTTLHSNLNRVPE